MKKIKMSERLLKTIIDGIFFTKFVLDYFVLIVLGITLFILGIINFGVWSVLLLILGIIFVTLSFVSISINDEYDKEIKEKIHKFFERFVNVK